MKIIGLDGGFGFVKYIDKNQMKKIVSLVSPARRIRFSFDFNEKNFEKNLWVKIDGKEYFIGEFAREQGLDPFQVLDKDKIYHESTKILMKTALGLSKDSVLKVVTGLPVSNYEEGTKAFLVSLLKGKHSVIFKSKDGEDNYPYEVKDVLVIPQPVGSLFDILLNSSGHIKKDSQKLTESTIAIIDIGFGTVDFSVIRNLEYIDKSSRSIMIGIKDLLEIVREEIAFESKEELPLYEIERLVTSGKEEITIKGKKYEIKKIVKEAASITFNKMKTIANYLWDKEKTIDVYVLTGGGLYLLKDEFKKFYGNKISTIYIQNPAFANVRGFYKYGLRKWRDK